MCPWSSTQSGLQHAYIQTDLGCSPANLDYQNHTFLRHEIFDSTLTIYTFPTRKRKQLPTPSKIPNMKDHQLHI